MLHFLTPYRSDKNLALAYNDAMKLLPDSDSACLRDIDTLFLLPEQPAMIEAYAKKYPDAILTCYCNRISELSRMQLLTGTVDFSTDITIHIGLARQLACNEMSVTEITRDISGFLMVVPKSIWINQPFVETGGALGVDTYTNRKWRAAGIKILRMNTVYIWHTYRLENGIGNKTHLK